MIKVPSTWIARYASILVWAPSLAISTLDDLVLIVS